MNKIVSTFIAIFLLFSSIMYSQIRVDFGEFAYPWNDADNPLATYRDIAIQLGFARAQNAPSNEPEVRKAVPATETREGPRPPALTEVARSSV